MSQTHIIGQQYVELSIANEREAFRLQEQFSELLRTRVVNEINETLDLFSDPNITIRIDRLDVDIGRIATSDLDRSLAIQVREVLERELSHALSSNEQSTNSKRLLKEDRIVALWLHAMQHGYVPWWSSPASAADLDRQLEQVLQSVESLPEELVMMLRSSSTALRRVASQNSTRLLKRLTQLLDKKFGDISEPIFEAMSSRLENRRGVRVRYEDSQRIFYKVALRKSVFPVASEEKTRIVDLLRSALKELSEEQSVSLTDLSKDLRLLIEPTTRSSGVEQLPAPYHQFLEEVLDRIAGPAASRLNISSDSSSPIQGIENRAVAEDESSGTHRSLMEVDSLEEVDSSGKVGAKRKSKLKNASRVIGDGTEGQQDSSPNQTAENLVNNPTHQVEAHKEKKQILDSSIDKDSIKPDLETREIDEPGDEASSETALVAKDLANLPEAPFTPKSSIGEWKSRESGTAIREGDTIYIEDAGAILLHPFLHAHFEALDLWCDGEFVDERSREIAVHQIRYLTTSEEETPEHLLVLPKILCGLVPDAPIERFVRLEDRNKLEADELLRVMIEYWGALKSTSPDGLRETFLRREGVLTYKPDGWRLRVESRGYDILLNRLPWPVSIINLPWMPEILHVEWI